MTTRNLIALFDPRAIALIGASNQPGSVGSIIARNLLDGGFKGNIYFVNPHETEILGVRCYPTIGELPDAPDLAVVATPCETLPSVTRELGEAGCRAGIVITAGLTPDIRARMLQAARPYLLRLLGPNCLGFLSPGRGINASFAPSAAAPGSLALLSQSGAVATAMLDWANGNGVGFSHILSLGDMSDIDFGDMLDFLAFDRATRAILIYSENVTSARKFMSAARIASRAKPVVMVKAGRSAAGARAAASHTGALAGSNLVYEAALRRAGIQRVDRLEDLIEAAETLATGIKLSTNRLTIITNGGGLGVLATDELERSGGELTVLTETAMARLNESMPAAWSRANPIDILGDAHADRYESAIAAVAAEFEGDAVLIGNCPTGVADSDAAASAVISAHIAHPTVPMIGCWMGEAIAGPVRRRLLEAGIPTYATPEAAVEAFQRLVAHNARLAMMLEAPRISTIAGAPDRAATSRALIRNVLAEGRTILTEPESKHLLAAYGVPVVETISVRTPEEAETAARGATGPLVLKILSRDITHKTDVGGVRLNLESPDAVAAAARVMLADVARAAPSAKIDGLTLQPMINRPSGIELIAGITIDATFGPCIMFGQGGVAAEVIADRVVALPPLNDVLARDMIGQTRISRLLRGYRDRPAVDMAALVRALVSLSDMASELADLAELDINPLLADHDGVIALDARIVVRQAQVEAADRLAIRPYPAHLVRPIVIGDEACSLRPILPEDAHRLVELGMLTSPADLRLRFHGSVHVLSGSTATRLSQIDYDREMVFVAAMPDSRLGGVVRLVFDPDYRSAELAILVRSDLQDRGLGRTLLQGALAYGFDRGAALVHGDVMAGNERMLDLALHCGGIASSCPEEAGLVRVTFAAPSGGRA